MHSHSSKKNMIRTGLAELDGLLRGGIELGLFTLFYGDRHVNQLLLRLAVSAQLPINYGGINSPVIFIDADMMFNPFEVDSISRDYGIKPAWVLDNIYIVRAFNFPMLIDILSTQLPRIFSSTSSSQLMPNHRVKSAKTIIISGVTPKSVNAGVADEMSAKFTKAIGWIRSLAMKKDIAIIASAPIADHSKWKPAGGTILQHAAQIQIFVKSKRECIEYLLTKHPSCPPGKAIQWRLDSALTNYTLDLFMGDSNTPYYGIREGDK
ncbi:MAG: hypothetical protein ACTSYO_07225 [Candidatus Ranarchaeia archaeon]